MSIAEKLTTIAENQQRVYDAGFTAGQAQGGGGGYNEGYEAAKEAFADAYQTNADGTQKTNYYQHFIQTGWCDETFAYIRNPIICSGGSNNGTSVFSRSRITQIHVPVIVEGIAANELFYYAQWLVTIDNLVFINVTELSKTFGGCSRLRHINFGENSSIDVSCSFSASPNLDEETVQNIIDCLKDLAGLTQQTLTFHNTVGSKLTDAQKATITAKNWALVY